MIRRLWVALTAALLSLGLGLAVQPATAQPALPQATTCSGVWVIVDKGPLGGTSTRCASSYSTGATALTSAGFSITRKSGMICTIGGVPDPCAISNSAYWSYWHAQRRADGSYGAWTYSNLGADSYNPKKGDAEGWRFGNGSSAPGVRPPRVVTATPKPTPKPTATKSTPKPTPTATKKTTPTPKASAKASAKPTPSATPVPTESPVIETPSATPVPATPEPSGTPTGLLATVGIVGVVGAGLLGWRRFGRRP